jgi:hypothetical protein
MYLISLVLVLTLARGATVDAQDVNIQPLDGPGPVLDGVKDDIWSLSTEQLITITTEGSPPDSPADLSGSWWILGDSDYLYFLVEAKDQTLVADTSVSDSWQDDSIEIYVDGDNSKGSTTDDNDYQYRVRWNTTDEEATEYFHSPDSLVGLEYGIAATGDGYILEVKIPWTSMIGGPAPAGQEIGVDVFINDDDDGGDRDSQVAWHSIGGAGWNTPSMWGTALILGGKKAYGPTPADDSLKTDFATVVLGASLSWGAGTTAAWHDVYFGENFDDVNDGTEDTFWGRQSLNEKYFIVGYGFTQNDPLPDGFVPGTTYYWRIDEVEADEITKHKGDVWSFRIPPKKTYDPVPNDGAENLSADPMLSWTGGLGAITFTPYFGESFNDVNNATGGTGGPDTSFTPAGPLEVNTTYYWRVDASGAYGLIKGDVWSFTTVEGGTGKILREVWQGIGGTSVGDLTTNSRYPNDPDIREYIPSFDGPVDWADNYGTRISGWLYVPVSGDYTFWIAGDDNCSLNLSTDIDPVKKQLIASVPEWTGHLAWNTYPEQQSDPITLAGGQKYYIEALQKEGGGGDSISVSWRGPASPIQSIIPAGYMCATPYDPVRAYGASPANESTDAPPEPTLTWLPGKHAESHELYFGTDYDAVANATTSSLEYIGPRALGSESYTPGKLEWEGTYYWRVDELSNTHPDSPWKGAIWRFTVANYLVIDHFEDYNTTDKQIWAIWQDGFGYWDLDGVFHPGNGTGSGVGDEDNEDTYMEGSIVNSGGMSMPYFFNNNDPSKMKYSEAKKTLVDRRDWTEGGVKALSLWFRGYSESVGSFTDNLNGTYTMTATGFDIWANADGEELDEFHFAYKPLNGAGSIIARVDSLDDTDDWAKAGVMIRETLDPNSAHAMIVVTPASGVSFQNRPSTGATSVDTTTAGITAPQWVKIERDLSGFFTASYSDDGQNWTVLGTPEVFSMGPNAFIGLAVTAHNVDATCQAEFSNVQVSVSGPWSNQDIGILSNDPERVYVAVSNSNGTTGMVYYPDNDNIVTDATQIDTFTEFNIDLKDFQDQGVNLADVNSVTVGIGTRGNTTPGGAGKMYIDSIVLYRPRCVPDKLTLSLADLNSDCVVDFGDLGIMVGDWLSSEPDLAADLNSDSMIDFKDYALLADSWLEEQLWP